MWESNASGVKNILQRTFLVLTSESSVCCSHGGFLQIVESVRVVKETLVEKKKVIQ